MLLFDDIVETFHNKQEEQWEEGTSLSQPPFTGKKRRCTSIHRTPKGILVMQLMIHLTNK